MKGKEKELEEALEEKKVLEKVLNKMLKEDLNKDKDLNNLNTKNKRSKNHNIKHKN